MKNKKIIIYLCISALVILLSFAVYFGFSNTEKTAIQNTSFVFTIISEILFFATICLITRKQENTFTRAGISSAAFIYIVVSLIVNIFIKNIFTTVQALITTNIIILILYIVTVLLVYLFKKEN